MTAGNESAFDEKPKTAYFHIIECSHPEALMWCVARFLRDNGDWKCVGGPFEWRGVVCQAFTRTWY